MTVRTARFEKAFSHSENGSRDPLVSRGVQRLERLLARVEGSKFLDRAGEIIGTAFVKVVRPGPFKEFISGSWLAHPVHPMLTDVTIGAWTSATILDVLGGEKARPGADVLVGIGILSAVPTAVTGLSDLTDIVESEDRSIGTAHALANVSGLVLWSMSYLARRTGSRRVGTALSMAGTLVMTGAGFLGGHLSYRRGVGVDQTTFDPRFGDWTAVMDEADLQVGQPRRVLVSGTSVFLYRTTERIHALANRCTHRGGPLHKGSIEQERVTCPWHLSTFRLDDGAVVRGPATAPQPVYRVRVRDGAIEIREP